MTRHQKCCGNTLGLDFKVVSIRLRVLPNWELPKREGNYGRSKEGGQAVAPSGVSGFPFLF